MENEQTCMDCGGKMEDGNSLFCNECWRKLRVNEEEGEEDERG